MAKAWAMSTPILTMIRKSEATRSPLLGMKKVDVLPSTKSPPSPRTVLPTTFAIFMEHFGERADRVVSLVFASSTLGGATLPWCVGAISARAGDLRVGLVVPVAACVAMLALQAGVIAVTRRD